VPTIPNRRSAPMTKSGVSNKVAKSFTSGIVADVA
jgi:hypothetical protein